MQTHKSLAKVNLTLDVLGIDSKTNYHLVQTVLHEVPDLFDELTFETRDDNQIVLTCDNPEVPLDDSNTIIKAAKLLQKEAPEKGVTIHLIKRIPLQSGLGGPSSNAATTLKVLNELWDLKLNDWTLRNLSADIGMDVPFFITGGCAIGMHYGEQLEHLPTLDNFGYRIEVIPTDIKVPTEQAYKELNLDECGKRNKDTGRFVQLLKEKEKPSNPDEFEELLHNDFEFNFFRAHPGHEGKHLSGSGGGLFLIVKAAV
jgi:4-diphosphocytidyl-2-C-methyl-D-erythritol kinase